MEREKKQSEPEQEAGAPEWMVTFSDCMTLLLTFFVLLLSFSSFDAKDLLKFRQSFNKAGPSLSLNEEEKDGLIKPVIVQHNNNLDDGSEKSTLAEKSEDSLINETESENFHEQKVFLIPSDTVFWGNKTAISTHGQKALSDMALFLNEVPDRVVISENRQGGNKDSEHLGLQRSWAIIEYLTEKKGLDKGRFSIAAGTLQKTHQNNLHDNSQAGTGRMLEIVLLERSIYN